jgi:hypothetical protein
LDENACGLTLYVKKIIKFSMDAETKKLREEFGLKHRIKQEDLIPEARGKTAAEIIRAQREKMDKS